MGGFPISIDFDHFNNLAKNRVTAKYKKEIKNLGGDAKVVISVERLDYTKGIKKRLEGVCRFFEKYPEFKKKVVFLQVAVPSRTKITEYVELKREIDEEVGRLKLLSMGIRIDTLTAEQRKYLSTWEMGT